MSAPSFFNLYSHDLIRVAIGIPPVRVADPRWNAEQTVQLLEQAHARGAVLALFPELGLSGYSCEDLFHQRALLNAAEAALARVAQASRACATIAVVGLPLCVRDRLYNCAVVLRRGEILILEDDA